MAMLNASELNLTFHLHCGPCGSDYTSVMFHNINFN